MVGYWRTQTIRAAVELGVFDALPARAEEIEHRPGYLAECPPRDRGGCCVA